MPDVPRPSEGSPRPSGPSGEPPGDPEKALAKLREGKGASSLGGAGKYAGLGLQFALSILLFLYAGQWLDRRLGTGQLFLLIGVFVGAGAAFYSMYRTLTREQRRIDDERHRSKEGGR
jgi:F0F1-type ATP synthase assembly protein I